MPHPLGVVIQVFGYFSAQALSIRMLVILALAMAGPADADPSLATTNPGYRIVLFGARWCGPCMLEYRLLPAIIAAAAPDRVVLAWVDKPVAIPSPFAGRADALSSQEAQRLAARVLGEGYGLPSAAMLNEKGQACSIWRAPLRPADVRQLQDQCRGFKTP